MGANHNILQSETKYDKINKLDKIRLDKKEIDCQ